MAGCAFYRLDTKGKKISDEEVKKITLGVTTRDEIIRMFGRPTSIKTQEDGSEELQYVYREEKTPAYVGGLIIYKRGARETIARLRVIIKDGKVVAYHYKKEEEK